jgi:hypothetical protein
MPIASLLQNKHVQNAATAAAAGVTVYFKPARLPRLGRFAVNALSAGASVGGMLIKEHERPGAKSALDLTTAVTGGVAMVSSALALRADAKVEDFLVKRGIGKPRIVMAAGVAVIVLGAGAVRLHLAKRSEAAQLSATPGEAEKSAQE